MSEFLHISLRSRDRDKTVNWYVSNLGFTEERRGTTAIGTQTAILRLPGLNTYIEVSDRVKMGRDFQIPEDLIHLAFTVTDMQAAHDRLIANGVKWTDGAPTDRFAFIEDCDGYEIELVTAPVGGEFDHFRLRVGDLDRSVAFYERFLGFRTVQRTESPRGSKIAKLELPGNRVLLELSYLPFLDPHFEVPEDLMHLAFPVDDMPTLYRDWESNGVVITEGRPDGGMIFAADPDGYELEMIQRRR
ncbi:MAG: VOC family protein [Chloroflexota bacterium]|nr:VOC family protein [Chloroflexota bacterium]NCA12737.1 hypothetical protein [Pseudomonadota bacterium]